MFTNEILFAVFALGGLAAMLGAAYFGRIYVYALMIAITIYINIAEAKVIDVFGFSTTLGTALFGVLYFATDLLTERYGKKEAFVAVKLGIVATVAFHLFMQLTLMAQGIADEPGSTFFADFSAGMDTVFTVSLRIVLASLFVYALIQSFDIWFYDKIHRMTGDKMLWLRNNGSTFVSQALDTSLFTFLAFFGSIPVPVMLEMIMVGYGFKVLVALCDTGFIYASKMFTPLDLRTAQAA